MMNAVMHGAGEPELVVVSASDEPALLVELERIIGFIDRVPGAELADVAYTCSLCTGRAVVAFVVTTLQDLRSRMISVVTRFRTGKVQRIRDRSGTYYFGEHLVGDGIGGRIAFVFPGVMSFYPDMMRDVVLRFGECRAIFDELEEAMSQNELFTPSTFVFPPASQYRHDADVFRSGAYAQALVATSAGSMALSRLLGRFGVVPSGIVGGSGGELAVALNSGAMGALDRSGRIDTIREIYGIVDKAVSRAGLPETAMIAIVLRHEGEDGRVVGGFPSDKVMLAVDSSPRRKIYAVAPEIAGEVMEAFAKAGIWASRLELDRPFNTPLCANVVPTIRKFAERRIRKPPSVEVYSCSDAARLEPRIKCVRDMVSSHWARRFRFTETIRRMHDDGYRVFVEVGPRGIMSSAISEILKDVPHAAVALNSMHRQGMTQLCHALGQLAALGVGIDLANGFGERGAKRLDFDAVIAPVIRRDAEMKLSRAFPKLTLLGDDPLLPGASVLADPKGRGEKAARRAAAVAAQSRRQRQFDFGAVNPLISDADILSQSPGVSIEIAKTFRMSEAPMLGDFALGSSQLSYSDPNLKGLVLLRMPVGAEIMAEAAHMVVPNRELTSIDDFLCRRMIAFDSGALRLYVKAERVAAEDPSLAAVKVQIRDDSDGSEFTWPVMEAVFTLAEKRPPCTPNSIEPLARPRNVHWSGREIYPTRLCCGSRLRGVSFVEAWSETGLDYDIIAPEIAGSVSFTRFPIWMVDPLLLEIAVSGFSLWRSHEKFTGAFAFPFRMRRLVLRGAVPKEGASLKCYLRLTSVTPKSQICDISVTDGNGGTIMEISGWEELAERVPAEYRNLILQPAMTYLTESLSEQIIGMPVSDVASAFVTDVPYQVFERNEELWLKTISHVILDAEERAQFKGMSGSTSRRTEWLFGRAAAKEAVRRYLKDNFQARWSDADVKIWADDSGKPHALGEWTRHLTSKLDIAIAHTSRFVIAIAASNMRVGVDVESVNRDLSDEFTNGVFSPEELAIAASTASPPLTIMRFWCAKEAVSKALGTGIRYSPKELVARTYDENTGAIAMRLEGSWAEAFKIFKGNDLFVSTRIMRDHALAFSFLPASEFEE